MRDWRLEVLVSRKGVRSDPRSEGSETTKVGSNEQKLDREATWVWVSKHIFVKPQEYQKAHVVDQVDIDGKNKYLPREISELVDNSEKSAEVIVPRVTSEAC
jgi:hypothetical protein